MNSPAWLDALFGDLRYAVRMLRKTPGFTLTAVITLGLAIGANTAVFSVVDTLLIRPLPYPEPDRLALVATRYESASRGVSGDQQSQDGRMWELVRDHATMIERAVYSDWRQGVNLVTPAGALYVQQQRVGAGFFRVLGVLPLVGREFTPQEDVPSGPAVAILSYDLWQRAFRGDPSTVGGRIELKGEPFTVVAVMPAGFRSSGPVDVWTPLRSSTSGEGEGTNYSILARLRPGFTWTQANGEISPIGAERLKQQTRSSDWKATTWLQPLQQGWTVSLREQLVVLWGAVIVVLLIACINIAGLLLARGAARTREIATRLALGGSRRAILQQVLVESIVLAVGGGVIGVALGWVALALVADVGRDVFGIWQPLAIDLRALAVTTALSFGCAILFGLAPAWHASRVNVQPALAEAGTRGATATARWPRRVLIVAEVALGAVLLVSAGLLVRTFLNLRALQPGFDGGGVVVATVSLDVARYRDPERTARLFEDGLARIRQTPGVEAAAVSLGAPYQRLLNLGFRRLDGSEARTGTISNLSYITPEFFKALSIPLVAGRPFESRDTGDSEGVAIVNQEFASRYFKGEDPLGRRIAVSGRERTIVGICGNVQSRDPGWGNYGPIAATAVAYVPITQTNAAFLRLVHTWFSPVWIVKSARGTQGLEPVVRAAIAAVDPQLPIARFQSMEQIQALATAEQRFMAALVAALGGIAALLAALGIHGLIATTVTERRRELGIRLALGASASQAMRSVAAAGVVLAAVGSAIGGVLAESAVSVIRSQLWGVQPSDPATFAAAILLLLVVAAVASTIPALSVLRLDPARTLRAE